MDAVDRIENVLREHIPMTGAYHCLCGWAAMPGAGRERSHHRHVAKEIIRVNVKGDR